MERANEVLAVLAVDCGLAANRGIDLREQRRRHLHVIDAASHHRRRKAREIADHAAAERHHHVVALDASGDQRLAYALECLELLRRLACRHDDFGRRDAGGIERLASRAEMQVRDRLVGDDRRLGAGLERGGPVAERGQYAAPDDNVIGALAQSDVDGDRLAGSQRRGHAFCLPMR